MVSDMKFVKKAVAKKIACIALSQKKLDCCENKNQLFLITS